MIKTGRKTVFMQEVYGEPSLMDYIRREVLPYVPYFTMCDLEQQCDITLDEYGYLHDAGFYVVIIDHKSPRHGTGWSNLDHRYAELMKYYRDLWRMAAEYSYR